MPTRSLRSVHEQQQQHENAKEHQEPRQTRVSLAAAHFTNTAIASSRSTSLTAPVTTRLGAVATASAAQQFLQLEGSELQAKDGRKQAVAG